MIRFVRIALYIILSFVVVLLAAWWITDAAQESKTMDDEARKSAPGQLVNLTDGVTHYVESGLPNGKPVVLIHGGGITGMEVWDNTAPHLSTEGRRVLTYDLYGRGYSDRVKIDYTSDLMNRQLEELLGKVNFPDTFDIICMSMGAMIAVEYAATHPAWVGKIVMLDPYATGDYSSSRLLRLPVVSGMLMTFYWQPRAVENQRKEFVNQPLFDSYAERLKYFMSFDGYKKMNYSTWMKMLQNSKMDMFQRLPEGKVMLIYGANDPYFSPAILQLYNDKYPSLKSHVVEGAGHMPHVEQPGIVNPLISEFLQ
ncbi:MAG TPA: alpha/beta hydrolase [Cyclobacteriaceae bacterium]|nr:alpha/beta hydrolase [Cyclobacteriaceae bacterium]